MPKSIISALGIRNVALLRDHLTVELSCGPATPVRTDNKHCTGLTESAAPRAARQLQRVVRPPFGDAQQIGLKLLHTCLELPATNNSEVSLPLLIVLALFVFTLYLWIRGILHLRRWMRGDQPASCGKCGYDVAGSLGVSTTCPECGSDFVIVGIKPIRRRTRWQLLIGIMLIVIPVLIWTVVALAAIGLP